MGRRVLAGPGLPPSLAERGLFLLPVAGKVPTLRFIRSVWTVSFTCTFQPKNGKGCWPSQYREAHGGGSSPKCTCVGSLSWKVVEPRGNPHLSRLYCPPMPSRLSRLSGEHGRELILAVFWQCPEPEGSRLEERRTILTAACTR